MILDNENQDRKVHEWIASNTEEGKFDIVTGYFTIGALAYIAQETQSKIDAYRMVLGDIVNQGTLDDRPLDLLNENISIEAALKLSSLAKSAVEFLKLDKVEVKTLEPNFCHAKAYLHRAKNDDRHHYFITGSSNLTEAGIGLKMTHNVELNFAECGNNAQYLELAEWFKKLWNKPQAHKHKTIVLRDGKSKKVPFKEYLIQEIERIFIEYSPKDLYYKVLFELFGHQISDIHDDPNFNRKLGRLENTQIYNALYTFQQKGVLSLIRMLQNYNGAILADAVGLGKTWSALAVIKYFEMEGREIVVLCPKKLEQNWRQYQRNQDSIFERDQLEYFIRYHTDLHLDRLEKYTDRSDFYFTNDKPKLVVIDESHNLRNDKSNRYQFLLENILKKNQNIKVLLLSATPINNSLNDIRNQFKLLVQGDVKGFENNLSVRNLDHTFRTAQKKFNEWRQEPNPQISDFIRELPPQFFTLTDSLIVARTRKMIQEQQKDLIFPLKAKPKNLFVTPTQIGNFESFDELFDHLPPMLSGYQPAHYLKEEETDILHDERQRDFFLVKMMYILMVKRLESSWFAFQSTVEKIKVHHQNALDKIKAYQQNKRNESIESEDETLFDEDDLLESYEDLTLGKKRPISIREIDEAENLENFKTDLKRDIEVLINLHSNLKQFEEDINKETNQPNNTKSADDKLEKLIEIIQSKRKSGQNNNNQKLLIFTTYRDTAEYLYNQLSKRGFDKMAMISGTGSRCTDSDTETSNFIPLLERFAPYTKLYKEKKWDFQTQSTEPEAYQEWIEWTANHNPKTHQKVLNQLDILIATDVLSEGQNLQDADMVINYDIHWNPVRIIQRMGRIDRIGSPNETIFGINFWPSDNINSYLNLQGRIEQRMATMKLAGSEVDERFTDTFREMIEDENLDQRMRNRMMEQMQITLDDLDGDDSFGFDDLSLESYRQDLLEEFNRDSDKYRQMPKAVYTGFKGDETTCPSDGIIALLGYPAKPSDSEEHNYTAFDLIYIDSTGKSQLMNQKEILNILNLHKDEPRYVPDAIDRGEEKEIKKLADAFQHWLKYQTVEESTQEDGTTKSTMGNETKEVLDKLRRGDKKAIDRLKENTTAEDKFQMENFDLIAWFLVNT